MDFPVKISFQELHLPFKATVRHASASRKVGESIWVEASRAGVFGYGEGCPRPYVTGERVSTCLEWYNKHIETIQQSCTSLKSLQAWMDAHTELLDKSPAAWSAVEIALLDLFARERDVSVEQLLGVNNPQRAYTYSAIMGDDEAWRYKVVLDMYLVRGFTDFKVKLNGDLERDQNKLAFLNEIAAQHGTHDIRIRLDANNLWHANPAKAVEHLRALDASFFAIEEPVMPKDVAALSQISQELDTAIILDESLCSYADLEAYDNVPGRFIANIKVSRVGGVLRALKLVKGLKERGWPIIVGAHVGETSVLTRAAMLVANAAGEQLIAQEGGFGKILVEHEPASPSLNYGHKATLDLSKPYAEKTVHGLRVTPSTAWNAGWGLECRSPEENHPDTSELKTLPMIDGYLVNYRLWGPEKGDDVVVILHGGMSHSAWQEPLAHEIRELCDYSVVAPDRRGCGLNENRGDFGSVPLVINDVVQHVEFLSKSFKRVHLAGWCQGAQYAVVAAERLQQSGLLSSLLFITPGLFWNERLRSVIESVKMSIDKIIKSFDLTPDRNDSFAPVPLEEADFTSSPYWLDYIRNDDLKTMNMSLKSVYIMDEIQELSWFAVPRITIPMYALIAENDRIVDNRKVREYLTPFINASTTNQLSTISAGHAVQFDQPEELAKDMVEFMKSLPTLAPS